jgi:hypothetical protein
MQTRTCSEATWTQTRTATCKDSSNGSVDDSNCSSQESLIQDCSTNTCGSQTLSQSCVLEIQGCGTPLSIDVSWCSEFETTASNYYSTVIDGFYMWNETYWVSSVSCPTWYKIASLKNLACFYNNWLNSSLQFPIDKLYTADYGHNKCRRWIDHCRDTIFDMEDGTSYCAVMLNYKWHQYDYETVNWQNYDSLVRDSTYLTCIKNN